ncbi:hypothetical protein [Reyranella sp. CPCC 100927]|uniref:hypothetical protein n=1 Tax=Reyranella sp. CPCC 100927 TaxID=2599616 RepID=UPI0011B56823|nr:hypothetical protein [Reyranella sp. CPCC 100927]TWT15416.1 hypothetical protein FQU96_03410 [Reyranella sp. CPCC 100927]
MFAPLARMLVQKHGGSADEPLPITVFDPDGNVVDANDRAAIRFARFRWAGWRLIEPYQAGQSITDYVLESTAASGKWSITISALSNGGAVIAIKTEGEVAPPVAAFAVKLASKLKG